MGYWNHKFGQFFTPLTLTNSLVHVWLVFNLFLVFFWIYYNFFTKTRTTSRRWRPWIVLFKNFKCHFHFLIIIYWSFRKKYRWLVSWTLSNFLVCLICLIWLERPYNVPRHLIINQNTYFIRACYTACIVVPQENS